MVIENNHPNKVLELTVTPNEIYQTLLKLNPNKATGPDEISNSLLKSCAGSLTSLCEPIAKIVNKSLETETFPHRWKTSNITALYKKGDPQIKSNYRPISLLSNTSKIVERIVFERLYRFLTEHDLLSKKIQDLKEGMAQ